MGIGARVSSHLCGNIDSELNAKLNLYWLKPVLQMLIPCYTPVNFPILGMGFCDHRADPGSVLCDQPKSSIGLGRIKLFFSLQILWANVTRP